MAIFAAHVLLSLMLKLLMLYTHLIAVSLGLADA